MAIQSSINQLLGSVASFTAITKGIQAVKSKESQPGIEQKTVPEAEIQPQMASQVEADVESVMKDRAMHSAETRLNNALKQKMEFEQLKGKLDASEKTVQMLAERIQGYEHQKMLRKARHQKNQERRVNPYGQK